MMTAQKALSTAANFLRNILLKFPKQCDYCFAYGSGIFIQTGQKPGKMIDIIFVVNDPLKWHAANLEMNFSHYSGLRRLGPGVISAIQEGMASGVYYNPFVSVDDTLIKYGVISTQSLEEDLSKWTQLYLAGRLHKPVLDIVPPQSRNLPNLLRRNRDAALRAALLLSPSCVRKIDLYYTITELSYMGDFRMLVGEHPDKVRNIVTPIVPYFDQIYLPLLDTLKPLVKVDKEGVILQDVDSNGRLANLMGLPHPIQRALARRIRSDPRVSDVEDAMVELSHVSDLAPYVKKSISQVVAGSSVRQTVQGILTAGVIRSIKYGFEKIQKKVTAGKSTPEKSTPAVNVIVQAEISKVKEPVAIPVVTIKDHDPIPKSQEESESKESTRKDNDEAANVNAKVAESNKSGRQASAKNLEQGRDVQNKKRNNNKGAQRQVIIKAADVKGTDNE